MKIIKQHRPIPNKANCGRLSRIYGCKSYLYLFTAPSPTKWPF